MLILCNIYLRYLISWYAQLFISLKKSDHDIKLKWRHANDIHLWNNKHDHPEKNVTYK